MIHRRTQLSVQLNQKLQISTSESFHVDRPLGKQRNYSTGVGDLSVIIRT